MAEVITVANQKGGIGKTTTALAIAPIIQSLGYKTLFIDIDAQCNSTSVYGAKMEGVNTIYDVIISQDATAQDSIQKTDYGEIIAGDRLLTTADVDLTRDAFSGLTRLKTAIAPIKDQYDYIIMDTNPVVNRLLFNALIASDKVIIPASADRFGLEGISQMLETITAIQKGPNPNLNIGGIVLTKYKGNIRLERQVYAALSEQAEMLGIPVYKTMIRENIKIRESQSLQIPPNIYAPKSTTVRDYTELVHEIIGE